MPVSPTPPIPRKSRSTANPPARITLREVAKAAGLHFSTVSLALRNSPRLPLKTRQKVQAVAKRLNYRPDPMLSALNAYRLGTRTPHYQGTLAWINNWPKRADLWKNQGFCDYFQGASERATQLGYNLEEFWLNTPGMSLDKFISIFKARNIQGLLLAPQPHAHTLLPMDYSRFSVLCFGYSLFPSSFHVVTNHQYHCMNVMLENLVGLGYRRIGVLLTKDWNEKADNNYLSGVFVAQSKRLLKARFFPHVTPHLQQEDFNRWMKKCTPDVVVTLSLHKQIAQWLKELGMRIPEDVGLASLNVALGDKYLSGMYQNSLIVGRTAIDYLVTMLHRGECGVPEVPIRILVENTWHPGQTVKKIR